uniref:BhlA/UviB family holin-like peptide n=1 Tax=Clostridium haemolyticum TaxID=84025 RepID=UPI00226C8DB5|nr:BhlA/UviB family holin-like peptide [Clostridium haemolyticum]
MYFFVFLIIQQPIYILKAQEKRDTKQELRERNYQSIIENLTDKFNLVEDVKKDVEDIKEFIHKTNT